MVALIAAERQGRTPWHPHHITERYGLFTLILLGESLLSSANAIITALHDSDTLGPLIQLSVLAFVVTAALWWICFWPPHHEAIGNFAASLRYGYVHFFVFAAAGALSAGIEVEVDQLTGHTVLGASFTVTVPVAVFILCVWWIAMQDSAHRVVNTAIPIGAVVVLLDPLIPSPVALTTLVLVAAGGDPGDAPAPPPAPTSPSRTGWSARSVAAGTVREECCTWTSRTRWPC